MRLLLIGFLAAASSLALAQAPEKIQLKTDDVHFEMLAGIGARATHLSLPGKENFFRVNQDLLQRHSAPQVDVKGYNLPYFGHEVWLGPQSAWWKQQNLNEARNKAGAVWPPDPYLVLAPYEVVVRDEKQVQLRGPESPVSGVRMSKTYSLASDQPGTIVASASVENIRQQPVSWGLWFNSRVHSDTQIYVPVSSTDAVRVVEFPGPNSTVPDYTLTSGLFALSLTPPGEGFNRRHGKIFIHPSAGWLAGFRGDQLLIIHFDLQPRELIHPEQGQIELYHDYYPEKPEEGVLELEVHFPYGQINPGEMRHGREKWTLVAYSGENTASAQRKFLCEQLKALSLDASVCADN